MSTSKNYSGTNNKDKPVLRITLRARNQKVSRDVIAEGKKFKTIHALVKLNKIWFYHALNLPDPDI